MEPLLLGGLALAALIGASAFFSGTELAFLSISSVRLHALVEKKVKNAESLSRLRDNRRRVIISLLIGNNIANIAASALATSIAIGMFGSEGLGIAIGVMTLLMLTFGEIVPKSAAAGHSEKIMLAVSPAMEIFYAITYPLVIVFEQVNRLIPGVYARATRVESFSEEEVRSAVKLSAKSKGISEKERELIENVLKFNDTPVSQVMTPKEGVEALNASLRVREAHNVALRSKYSRFPVVMDGKPIGVISGKTLAIEARKGPGRRLFEIPMPLVSVKTADKANVAFSQLQGLGRNIAIVVDDKEEFAGVVTLEDLLEELVGEIK